MKVLAIFVVVLIGYAAATDFLKCSEGKAPSKVEVEGCEKTPCKLKRGTNVDFRVEFDSELAAETLIPKVKAHVQGITVPYPLPGDLLDGCKFLTEGQCPLTHNGHAKYEVSFPVQKSFPVATVTVEYFLMNEKDEVVTCFQVPIKTV